MTLSASGLARFISGRYTASANLPSRTTIRDVVAAADEVTASNDQDGVVLVLDRLAIRKLTAKTGVESRERPLRERENDVP